MSAPHCGICGSIDVVMDESGLFICHDCGARFTLEAMRNLMNEDAQQQSVTTGKEDNEFGNDSEGPEYRWGDADSDLLVKHCESDSYDLAAALWKRLETREEPVHPWVVLQGKIATELVNINDESFKAGLIYRDYVDAYKAYYVDPRMRGLLDIYALQILKIAGTTIAEEQKRVLNALTANSTNQRFDADNYVKVLGYQLSSVMSADIDYACYYALIDIAGCVGKGYLPGSKEWNELSGHVTQLKASEYYPLLKRIYERLLNIVSLGVIPEEYIEKNNEDGIQTLLDYAYESWNNHDYDIAIRAYEQLQDSDSEIIALEAKVAIYLFSKYHTASFAYHGWINEDFNKKMGEYFIDASAKKSVDGIRLCERFLILSAIFTEMSDFMTFCAAAYMSSDYKQSNEYRESAEKLLDIVKRSYQMFCSSVRTILERGPVDFDEGDYAHLKTVLNIFPDTLKGDEWQAVTTEAKNSYIGYLGTDQAFLDEVRSSKEAYQEKLSEVRSQLAPLKSDYDQLGTFAFRKKDSIRKQMMPLLEREQNLLSALDAIESEISESRWDSLAENNS